jgi:hypothetical protein
MVRLLAHGPLWGPPSLLYSGYWGLLPRRYSGQTWSWPSPPLTMSGAEPLLPSFAFMPCAVTSLPPLSGYKGSSLCVKNVGGAGTSTNLPDYTQHIPEDSNLKKGLNLAVLWTCPSTCTVTLLLVGHIVQNDISFRHSPYLGHSSTINLHSSERAIIIQKCVCVCMCICVCVSQETAVLWSSEITYWRVHLQLNL